jgi:hypothetical protein
LFRKAFKNVMYFEGSVKGLQIGASVVVRGVQIGQVTDIVLDVDVRDLTAFVPVYVEIYQQKIVPREGGHDYDQQFLRALIEKGLRAQLQPQSIITGQLMVDLDFHRTLRSDSSAEKGIPRFDNPFGSEQLTRRLEKLPLTIAKQIKRNTCRNEQARQFPRPSGKYRLAESIAQYTDALVKIFVPRSGLGSGDKGNDGVPCSPAQAENTQV